MVLIILKMTFSVATSFFNLVMFGWQIWSKVFLICYHWYLSQFMPFLKLGASLCADPGVHARLNSNIRASRALGFLAWGVILGYGLFEPVFERSSFRLISLSEKKVNKPLISEWVELEVSGSYVCIGWLVDGWWVCRLVVGLMIHWYMDYYLILEQIYLILHLIVLVLCSINQLYNVSHIFEKNVQNVVIVSFLEHVYLRAQFHFHCSLS